jgi:hypothetical protein
VARLSMIPTPEVSSTHGEPSEAGKESEDDQESDAPEEPQRHEQAPSPNEPAVGARPATFLILQFPQLGRWSWHRLKTSGPYHARPDRARQGARECHHTGPSEPSERA